MRCLQRSYLSQRCGCHRARAFFTAHSFVCNRRRSGCHYAVSSPYEMASLALSGGQAALAAFVLKPVLSLGTLFFVVRIVMSWDPAVNTDKKLPWSIFYKPTEPLLAPTRRAIQPVGGVDVSPIIWTFIFSLANELLLGPQGVLVLIERQGGM